MKSILIIGGHLTPALAVIEELKKSGEWNISWVGRKYAMEGQDAPPLEFSVIPKMRIAFHSIETGRLQRRWTKHTLHSLLKIPGGFMQARKLLYTIRPDIILSFGGYLSVPVGIMGWMMAIPIVVHEQTVAGGLANRIVSRFAAKVAISFKSSLKDFPPKKVVLTGNPIRKSLLSIKNKPQKPPLIYVTGGNQGSRAINELVVKLLPVLTKDYIIVHQTGFIDYPLLRKKRKRYHKAYRPFAILEPKKVEEMYKNVTLVISRAGANTITEIAAVGIPAILIPLPWAGANEQEKNALVLAQTGIARMLKQASTTPQILLKTIHEIFKYPPTSASKEKAKKLVNSQAAQKIVEVLNECVR